MLERLPRPWRNLSLALLAVLVLWFCWWVRSVLNPLILGYLLAYIMAPVVRRLEKRGLSHRTAANLIFVGGGLAALVIATGLAYQSWRFTRDLIGDLGGPPVEAATDGAQGEDAAAPLLLRIERSAVRGIAWVENRLEGLGLGLFESPEPAPDAQEPPGGEGETAEPGEPPEGEEVPGAADGATAGVESLREFFSEDLTAIGLAVKDWLTSEEVLGTAGEAGARATGGVFRFLVRLLREVIGLGTLLMLLPIYTYFLLFELDRIHGFVHRYLPHRDRDRITRVGAQIGEVLSNFFRGRLIVCLLKGLAISIGLALFGVPYSLLLGMASGFLSLIPFVGPTMGFAVSCVIGLSEFDVLGSLWRNILVFSAGELIEGYVLLPKILGNTLGLHEIVVLASLMVGGAALGMFGMLIALPVTATLVILAREFVLPALAAWADESAPGGATPR